MSLRNIHSLFNLRTHVLTAEFMFAGQLPRHTFLE